MRVLVFLACLLGMGCSATPDAGLTVFAASSLTETFSELGAAFERRHDDSVAVSIQFSGSQTLRLQIEQGAQADLFASANKEHIDELREQGLIRDARAFAATDLVVVTPVDDTTMTEFADLANAEGIVIGTEGVPVGRYAREVIANAQRVFGADFGRAIRERVVSEEANTRLVRAKVELGEARAALIYRTDALSSDRVRVVEIPAEINVSAQYWIAEVEPPPTDPRNAHVGGWIELLTGDIGHRVLTSHGFAGLKR